MAAGDLPHEAVICGAAGTGKTWSILALLHGWLRTTPNRRLLIARKVRAALAESVLVIFEQEVLPLFGDENLAEGPSRSGRRNYVYANGSEIVLCGLDKPGKALSSAYDKIFVNEAIETTEEDWETLGSRLDRPGRPKGLLLGDTNPGNPSHWIKKRGDAGTLPVWQSYHRDNPRLHDGSGWTEEGIAYDARLSTLTGTRRKRLKLGIWAAGEGAWFGDFDHEVHVDKGGRATEYDPAFPAYLAIDCNGLHVAAVWWQERPNLSVTVFGDYFAKDRSAGDNAAAILARSRDLCGHRVKAVVGDPAGKARMGFNTTIFTEYELAGLAMTPWPSFPGSIAVGLDLVDSFLPATRIHPRCVHLIDALANYMRAQQGGQWLDRPVDPQHPHEDLVDTLRGGLMARWPEGRKVDVKLPKVRTSRVF